MAGFRKRTYGTAFNGSSRRAFKKRRYTKRRPYRNRARRSIAFSTQAGSAGTLGFRSKRLSRRSWNKKLWDSTLQKAHFRSNGSLGGAVTSIAAQATVAIGTAQAVDNGVGPFWTAAGGAVVLDQGVAVPTFNGDIIIRGGMVGIKFYNESTTIPVQIKLWLIKSAPRPTIANVPASAPFGWEPTLVSEFKKDVGTIIFSKEFQLEPVAEMTVERRLFIMKVDQEAWSADQQRLIWLFTAGDPVAVSTNTTRITTYFNLSFAGDAV